MEDELILGIDLGTTNTAAAWALPNGQIRFVEVSEGVYSMPSAVHFHEGGAALVGSSARQMLVDAPAQTIVEMKRFLGRRFMSDFVGRHRSRYAFEIVEGPQGLAAVRPLGDVLTLEDVSQRLLARVLELAAVVAGDTPSSCVLTVPTHYTYRQRESLRRVAERTGLEVVAMIAEPTAAALYLLDSVPDGATVLIYDLGGGTFDTTLLRVEDGRAKVLGAGGDAFLGGADFDNRILEFLCDHFTIRHGVDPRIDAIARARMRFAIENAKIDLSTAEKTTLHVPAVLMRGDSFLDFHYELTREQLERICAPLIERTLGLVFATLEQAGVAPEEVTHLVPVGGQSKMPALGQRLRQHFAVAESSAMYQDLAVAAGAALRGLGADRLRDVLSLPVFGMTPQMGPRALVERNEPLPARKRIPLPRPMEGVPLAVPVYEAVDLTSIDRDVLGVLRAPREWLDENAGELHLDVEMDTAFALRFALGTDRGSQLMLELEEPQAQQTPGAPSGPGLRSEERVRATLPVLARLSPNTPFQSLPTAELSTKGMFVVVDAPPPLGASVELIFETAEGPLTLHGVVRSRVEPSAANAERRPGFGVQLRALSPKDAERYAALVEAARHREVDSAAAPPPTPAHGGAEVVQGAEALKRFLDAVRRQEYYEALGIQPLDGQDAVRTSISGLIAVTTALKQRTNDETRARLMAAEQLLERVGRLLLDPRARLTYDFKKGYVFAAERLARADEGGIFDPALLQEVWTVMYGGLADRVPLLLAQASAAETAGDLRTAYEHAKKALEMSPFDARLRSRVRALAARAGIPV